LGVSSGDNRQSRQRVKPLTTDYQNFLQILKVLDFEPTKRQLEAITNVDGPQLIVAGPGSGKTQVLVMRTLYLLLIKKVDPSRILVCTYTEKAAATLQDRIRRAIRDLKVEVDLTELCVGTIHSICADLINENITATWLTKGYEVLDGLTQQLFLFENFYRVIGPKNTLGSGKWTQISRAIDYFTKITEDMIDVEKMLSCSDPKLQSIGRKYRRYEETLRDKNSVDFAHLQSIVLELLHNPRTGPVLKQKFDHIMIDEYQDTNYLQERIFLELSEKTNNICVVGDEDQSLYRFRGAVVENFLNFPRNFANGKVGTVKLEENFRSTPQIVDFINKFVNDFDWSDDSGNLYRYEKEIKAMRTPYKNGMESVYFVSKNSGRTIAKLIKHMLEAGVIEDLNQVAILLRSVAFDGKEIMDALGKEGVKYYATRARGFFRLPEVKAIVGALLSISGFMEGDGSWNPDLNKYYDDCLAFFNALANARALSPRELKTFVTRTRERIESLQDSLKAGIVDLFYELLAFNPFQRWKEDPLKGRNLAILSSLLTKFQEYYHLPVITEQNWKRLRNYLFNSFLYSMRQIGLDEYEDPYDIFPSGYVQVMTIHQAKGLEFPVVIVSSLDKGPRTVVQIDKELEPFRPRKHTEPWEKMSAFDHSRLYYVAFSRAMDLLLLADDNTPHLAIQPAVSRAAELTSEQEELILALKFRPKEFLPPKPEFSITGHIHAYDVCPRQYKYYKEYEFTGSRSAGEAFGSLVHYTIEDIHRHYLETKEAHLDEKQIEAFFEKSLRAITRGGAHPLGKQFVKMARDQVINYYEHNKGMFAKLVRAEEPILVERENYVMSGIIDLIRGEKGQLELLDFKAEKREDLSEDRLGFYKFQLAIYAKMIEKKLGERPSKTYIYLTAEEDPKTALTAVPIEDVEADQAENAFDEMAGSIIRKEFDVKKAPPRDICRNCDFRYGCSDRKRFYPELKT
jgi:DNA helicase-2/ATP-dependent DNA helicase PcrA